MSDLRKAAEEVVEAWGWDASEQRNKILREKIQILRQALDKPEIDPKTLVSMAVLAEREACASLCSTVAAGRDAEAIEEAIRARGEK